MKSAHDDDDVLKMQRELFRSMSRDEPSREARRVVAGALGMGTVALAPAAAASAKTLGGQAVASASKGGSLLLAKWIGVGVVAGTMSIGAVQYGLPKRNTPAGALPVRSNTPRARRDGHLSSDIGDVAPSPVGGLNVPEPAVEPLASSLELRDRAEIFRSPSRPLRPWMNHRRSVDHEPKSESRERTPASPPASTLASEVALLDRMRSAIARNDGVGGEASWDEYMRAFPHGTLKLEATVLLVEALFLAGRTERASALGRELLETQGASTHASRVRYLLSQHTKP